MHFVALKYGL